MSQAVMRMRKVNMKASMWLPISPGLVGELAMAVTEPTESERPKIRSARVSILGRGRFSVASRCISIARAEAYLVFWQDANLDQAACCEVGRRPESGDTSRRRSL